jgi:TolC family type I secretion outer membrane protein
MSSPSRCCLHGRDRDRAIVELNNNQVRVLTTNLEATRDRFQIGDITRTDVAQSEARLSLARAALATAQGRLSATEENYRRIIGRRPDALQPPPPLPPLPTSPDQAVQIALANNPDLIAITRQADAAGFDVRTARAGRLPTVSAVASGDYSKTIGNNDFALGGASSGTATTVGVSGRIPIYQGGLPAARIRQAQALEGQTLELRIATERAVVSNTRSAFATYQAAQNAIASSQVAVSANELALEGARAENSVGTRTILDVLNAEQELVNAQVQLVTARRDAYVAGFQLLNAMGQAEADDLGLEGGPLYDPLGNYRSVAGNWNDWAGEPRANPVATRTGHSAGGSRGPAVPDRPTGRDSGAAISDRQAMAAAREPSMEDILASIKRVIAEEKEIRAAAPPPAPAPDVAMAEEVEDDVLELEEVVEEQLGPPIDLGPPLLGDDVADSSRMRLEELASVAAAAPPPVPAANPLEELVREMLRPILKQWLDDYLPHVVDEHVKREINRITGKPV